MLGCILGVFLVSVTQNGLNLLGISPYAFKMIVGAIILVAISLSNAPLGQMLAGLRQTGGHDRGLPEPDEAPSATGCAGLVAKLGAENVGLALALIAVVALFSSLSPRFLTHRHLQFGGVSVARARAADARHADADHLGRHQSCGHLHRQYLRADARLGAAGQWRTRRRHPAFLLGSLLAIGVGTASGLVMGLVIAYTGAHPILVSLSMMIFLRGLGEFLTRGGDISGFPGFIQPLGHGSFFGVPIPLLILWPRWRSGTC